jgi:histone deacetylase 1/2
LYVKKLTRNNNVFVEFHPYDVFVKNRDSREIILSGQSRGGLYPIGAAPVKQAFSSVHVSSAKWHCRLGHPTSPIVHHVLYLHAPPIESSNKDIFMCDACQHGKSHQFPFPLSTLVIKTPLELIYSDVWGPAQTSVSGHNYYVSFIDAYSRFAWLYLLKRKFDVFDVFVQF